MGVMKSLNVARLLGRDAGFRMVAELNPEQLIKRQEKRERTILFKQGGYVSSAMKRSMRYSKKPSTPGEPPNAHKDTKRGPLLRKLIKFVVNWAERSVVIGPPKVGNEAESVPHIIDVGGRVPVAKLLTQRTFTVGQIGPIRYLGAGKFQHIPLKTAAQAARAQQLLAEENAVRRAKGSITIKARPFTKPMLTDGGKNLHELVAKTPL